MRSVLRRAAGRLGPARRLGLILILVAVVPAHGVAWLAGAPASSPVGLVTLALGILLALTGRSIPRPAILTAVAIAALALKIAFVPAPAAGFEGCYQVTEPPLGGAPHFRCERSYEDPFATDRTRVDRTIAFTSWSGSQGFPTSSWTLTAINSDRYDFYRPSPINRNRLPFAVVWHGRIDTSRGVAVTYVGSGSLQLDGVSHDLPESRTPNRVVLPAQREAGMVLTYRWRDDGLPTSPFAAIQLTTSAGVPIEITAQPLADRILEMVLALALGVALAGAAWAVLREVARSPLALGLLAAGAAGAAVLAIHAPVRVVHHPTLAFFFLALVPWLVARRWLDWRAVWTSALVYDAILAAAIVRTQYGSVFGGVLYQEGGSDALAYESFARAILTQGDLQGGENVFVYSPAMRYFMYLQHMVVGDRDGLILVAGLVAVAAGALFAFELLFLRDLVGRRRGAGWRPIVLRIALVGALALTFMLLATDEVSLAPHTLRSESPTWVLLLFVLPLAIVGTTRRSRLLAAALLGVMFTFRADQSPGLAMIGLVILAREYAATAAGGEARLARAGQAARLIVPAVAIAVLPAVHNLVFGHVLVFLPTSPRIPLVFPLSPLDLPRLGSDPAVRHALRSQLGGVLVVPSWDPMVTTSRLFRLACQGLQASLVVVLVLSAARRFRGEWLVGLLVAVPVAYLTAHVFVQVYYAYPRHIVAGYLAGCLVLVAVLGHALRAVSAEPA